MGVEGHHCDIKIANIFEWNVSRCERLSRGNAKFLVRHNIHLVIQKYRVHISV